MALATLAEVKALLGITYADDDAQLTPLIAGASTLIERYTGATFALTEFTDVHDGGGEALILDRLPVVSVASVTDRIASAAVAEFEADPATGMIYRGADGLGQRRWQGGRRRFEVAYTAGHDGAPDDMKQALAMIVAAMRENPAGMTAQKDGDYSFAASGAVPAAAQSILMRYRSRP